VVRRFGITALVYSGGGDRQLVMRTGFGTLMAYQEAVVPPLAPEGVTIAAQSIISGRELPFLAVPFAAMQWRVPNEETALRRGRRSAAGPQGIRRGRQ
jgi:hypothetical protein